ARTPGRVNPFQQELDMVSARPFPRLAALAHKDGEDIQIVPGGLDLVVGDTPDTIPHHGEELHQERYRVTLGMRGDRADNLTSKAMERFRCDDGPGDSHRGRRILRGLYGLRRRALVPIAALVGILCWGLWHPQHNRALDLAPVGAGTAVLISP